MKKSFLILIFCVLCISSQAQFAKPLKSRNYANRNTSPFCIGLTGSYAANDMWYTALSKSSFKPYHAPTFGLAFEWNTMQGLAVGLDASYAMRGARKTFATEFLTSYSTTTFARVNYAINMNGVEIRVPITYYLGDGEIIRPYLYVAPRFDLWLNGNVRWERTYDDQTYQSLAYETELTQATTKPFDVSAVAGVGICSHVMLQWMRFFVKFDLSYGISMLNGFSQHEVNEDVVFQGWGDIEHEKLGKRRLHDVEARLTLMVPLSKPMKDACAFDQRMKKGK